MTSAVKGAHFLSIFLIKRVSVTLEEKNLGPQRNELNLRPTSPHSYKYEQVKGQQGELKLTQSDRKMVGSGLCLVFQSVAFGLWPLQLCDGLSRQSG